jgi:CBS domain-containing protein
VEVALRVRDIMTTDPIGVTPDTPLKEAARLMVDHHISGLPVIDVSGRLAGILTEGDFLRREVDRDRPRRASLLRVLFGDGEVEATVVGTVGEVMTKGVVTVSPEAAIGEAARIMASRKVKRLPVVDADGELVGIISRADVVNAFTKPDDVIEDEVREDVIRRLLFLDPDPIGVAVSDGVVVLAGELETRTEVELLEELVRRIAGVVRVENRLAYRVDDRRGESPYPSA